MRLIALCAAALSGVAVGDLSHLEPLQLSFAAVLTLLGGGLAWRRPRVRLLALATCALALGGLRASLVPRQDTAVLEPYIGQVVTLRGVVVQPPSMGPATVQFAFDAQHVETPGSEALPLQTPQGSVRVRVVGDQAALGAVAESDALVLEGRLLAAQGDGGPPTVLFPRLLGRTLAPAFAPSVVLGRVRAAAQAGIRRYLPEPQASLASGVLLGGAGGLSPDVRSQLQRSGLAHVVAIDGFKQVVVAAVLGGPATRLLGPRLAALTIVLGIAGYTLLTGAHPAAVRAGLMVGMAMLASRTGRLADPLTSVLVAATLMAAVEPRILLDVGLQLSVSATLGIVLLWPRVRPGLKGVPRPIAEPVGLTLAVTLATLPVTLSVFQLVSLVSPLAHVLAVPLLPLVLVSAAVLALVSAVPPVASVLAWLAWLPSTLLVLVIQLFGTLPGAALSTGRLPPVAAGGLAAALLAWGLWRLPEAAGLRKHLRRATAYGSVGGRLWRPGACVAACLTLALLLQMVQPDGRLHVQSLAAGPGQGEAVFIRGPTGRTTLVVGGRLNGVLLASQVADHLAVWEHRLDTLLQLDGSTEAGLGPTLARYPAEQRVDAAAAGDGAQIDLGGGAELEVHASAGQATRPDVAIHFHDVSMRLDAASSDELISDGTGV